jgi:hypothetical protein
VSDDFMGGGVKSFQFDKEGDAVVGTVIAPPEKLQQTDINTGELKFWDDGKPKWYFSLKLQTDLRDPEDAFDDGVRSISLSWKRLEAVRAAVKEAKANNIEVGGKLFLRFDAFEDRSNAKFRSNPAKVGWTAKYKPPVAEPEFMDQPARTAPADAAPTEEEHGILAQMAAKRQQVQEQLKPAHHGADDDIPF